MGSPTTEATAYNNILKSRRGDPVTTTSNTDLEGVTKAVLCGLIGALYSKSLK